MNLDEIEFELQKRRKIDSWSEEDHKELIKEALHEWLDEQYSAFGKWSLHGLLAAIVVAAAGWALLSHGGHI
jgi:hypothetical protein